MPESPEIAVPRFPYAQTVSPVKEFIEEGCDFFSKMEGFLGFFAFIGALCLIILFMGLYHLCSTCKKSKEDIEADKHTKGQSPIYKKHRPLMFHIILILLRQTESVLFKLLIKRLSLPKGQFVRETTIFKVESWRVENSIFAPCTQNFYCGALYKARFLYRGLTL